MGEQLLQTFETYGWKPDENLSEDENMMDLVLLITRSSQLKQGSMACILLRPPTAAGDGENESLLNRIIGVANNRELFKTKSSDIHAEVAAIGEAARHGRATEQCTAYITMPPCRKCYTALYAAGVERFVTIHEPPAWCASLADKIAMGKVADAQQSRARVQAYVDSFERSKQESGKKREREEE